MTDRNEAGATERGDDSGKTSAQSELELKQRSVDAIIENWARLLELLYRSTQLGGLLGSRGYGALREPAGELSQIIDALATGRDDRRDLIYAFQELSLDTAKSLGAASDKILEFFSERIEQRMRERDASARPPPSARRHHLVELTTKNSYKNHFTLTNFGKSERTVHLPEFVEFDGPELFRTVGLFEPPPITIERADTTGDAATRGAEKQVTVALGERTPPAPGKYWCTIELETPDVFPRHLHFELQVEDERDDA